MLKYNTHLLHKQNSSKKKKENPPKQNQTQQALHMLNTSSMEGEAGAGMTRQFKCSTVQGRPGHVMLQQG